ncbi:thioredoxin-like [Planococcus citri]|uniref:thioredoxin-like n=1 Tax=Planococcus citri TaxID=170843 RepID=UPI0031F99B7E
MFSHSNRRFFVFLTMVMAVTRNFYSVNTAQTEPPIEIVDAEEVQEITDAPTPAAETSARVTVGAASTDAPVPIESYYCQNSIDITTVALFEKNVLNSTKPIIVQFWGESSDPCKIMTARIGKAIDDKGGKIKLARVNIDDHKKIASIAGVKTVPIIVAYRGGEVIETLHGIKDESDLKIFVGKFIVD